MWYNILTMWNLLFWSYFVNCTMLICHEIDSAYWHEWKLFHLPGGITGFLVFNLAVIPPFLLGFVYVAQKTAAGLVFSAAVAAVGVFTFSIHTFFLAKGRKEFRTPASIAILIIILASSIVQALAITFIYLKG